jgi:DNA-binding beta-propeller fold protein YncE
MKSSLVFFFLLVVITSGFASSLNYYLAGMWGPQYPGSQIDTVCFMAVAQNGNVYLCDKAANKVLYFSANGSFLGQWGSTGSAPGCFFSPHGIDIDSSGNVLVADTYNRRIQKFTANGTYITEWGVSSGVPVDIFPYGLTIAPSGNIYVTSTELRGVLEFSPTGEPIRKWGPIFGGSQKFEDPYGIAATPDGNIYVSDWGEVYIFTGEGEYLDHIYLGIDSVESAIAASSNGLVYVMDYLHVDGIRYYSLDGTWLGTIPITEEMGCRRAVDSLDGARVYAADHKVCYFDSNTTVEPQSLGMIKGLYR